MKSIIALKKAQYMNRMMKKPNEFESLKVLDISFIKYNLHDGNSCKKEKSKDITAAMKEYRAKAKACFSNESKDWHCGNHYKEPLDLAQFVSMKIESKTPTMSDLPKVIKSDSKPSFTRNAAP